jgi:L-lactate dehydrogenase (cytochrome)
MKISHCNNIMDFRQIARKKLPAAIFHYLDGAADDEWTYRRNTSAFDDYELLPAQLSDVSNINLKTTLFGEELDWPVMISPTGASKLFHATGEPAVIRAAEKFGMIYSLSTLGTMTIEDVGASCKAPKMYQLYVFKDRGLTKDLIDRCKTAGFKALCLTVDTPVAGNRERDHVYGFATGKFRLRSVPSMLRHPGWMYRVLIGKDLEMVNLAASVRPDQFADMSLLEYFNSQLDRSLTWKDVEWLAEQWDGPLVIKGVQTVADCRNAANSGATAVMLSNHGGRQLESAPAPVDCIADVADALHDRLEIICDGGVRRGTHVVKALAMGASACSIGRAYLYPLAAGGQAGVERGLTLLRDELERTMALLGCNSIENLGSSFIRRRIQSI